MSRSSWYQDRAAWIFILLGYLPWLAVLNLAWEAAHVRLYTLWTQAEPAYIAFSVAHCTLGDVLIGGLALVLALVIGRQGGLDQWRRYRIGGLTVLFGTGYTVFSEWMNITLLRSWTYSESMPRLDIAGFELGVSPLAQWLVVPPVALYLASTSMAQLGKGQSQ